MSYILPLLVAFLISLMLTPWVRSRAFSWGAVDLPDHRKVHRGVMPRLGGLVVYLAFIPVILVSSSFKMPVVGLALGATIILILGITDDIRGISPRVKLAGQTLAALSVIPFGIRVDDITSPFSSEMLLSLGIFSVPLTVFWLVAVTNAVNLIDGLDGLAGGVSCIASLTMALVALTQFARGDSGQLEIMMMALVLAASILGFLKYNFHPASIFLGDTGSMLLGFSLGAISVMGLTKSATMISVIIPVVVMGIPLLDTIFAIVRRFHENRPIFQPDREHLHHQLLNRGFSHRQAVLLIYAVSIMMGASAVVMNIVTTNQAMVLLVLLATVVIAVANKIGVTGAGMKNKYPAKKLSERSSGM